MSLKTLPLGSQATLSGADTNNPTFTPDVLGDYVAQLVVTDYWQMSSTATGTVSNKNIAPVANAGTSQSVELGNPTNLNGAASSDADGDQLTYRWSITSAPAGSTLGGTILTGSDPAFNPDRSGTYVMSLVVNDGFVDSNNPATVTITVTVSSHAVIKAVQAFMPTISALNPKVFKNANRQNTLLNKFNTVIASIEAGNYADALGQLQNDILAKTDGFATTKKVDNNDWIIDPNAQTVVYNGVAAIIAELKAFMANR